MGAPGEGVPAADVCLQPGRRWSSSQPPRSVFGGECLIRLPAYINPQVVTSLGLMAHHLCACPAQLEVTQSTLVTCLQVVTSLGLMAHHLFGCWHGDYRLKRKYGEVRLHCCVVMVLMLLLQLCFHGAAAVVFSRCCCACCCVVILLPRRRHWCCRRCVFMLLLHCN